MFDSCICVDIDDECTLLRRTTRTARKEHKCVECRCVITLGQRYEEDVTLFEGEFAVYKTCVICVRIRDSLFECGWYYGHVWEAIHEAFCVDWNEDEDDFCICPGG